MSQRGFHGNAWSFFYRLFIITSHASSLKAPFAGFALHVPLAGNTVKLWLNDTCIASHQSQTEWTFKTQADICNCESMKYLMAEGMDEGFFRL